MLQRKGLQYVWESHAKWCGTDGTSNEDPQCGQLALILQPDTNDVEINAPVSGKNYHSPSLLSSPNPTFSCTSTTFFLAPSCLQMKIHLLLGWIEKRAYHRKEYYRFRFSSSSHVLLRHFLQAHCCLVVNVSHTIRLLVYRPLVCYFM